MPGVITNDYQPQIDAITTQLAQVPQFVTPSIMTVATMLAAFPPSSAVRGKYVRVSDYAGAVDRVLRCDYDPTIGSGLYFWNPTQAEYGRTIAVTGDVTFDGLTSPTSIVLSGSIAALTTRNINVTLVNRRPGEIIEIKNGLSSILGTLNILGTGIGTITGLALGGLVRILIDGSSGSLSQVRLQ